MTPNPKTPSRISAQLPIAGLPGQNGVHTVVPVFPEGDPLNRGGPGGLPGEYEVTFTLNRPGYPLQAERSASSSDALAGDSHLKIPQIFRIDAAAEGETFTFEGRSNRKGFLASIVGKCSANNILEAHSKCYKAVTPIISFISLKWDVPLAIYQVDVLETRTGTRRFTNRNPFDEFIIEGKFSVAMDPEARTYAAIYREALITESTTYQFLCFYRLIESIQARRKRIERDARRRRTGYTTPVETYPRSEIEATNFLNFLFTPKSSHSDPLTLNAILVPDAVGKNFADIVRDRLRPVRDNIAHTLLQRGAELISMDDPLSHQTIETWLPAIKCIARMMLENEFGFLFA